MAAPSPNDFKNAIPSATGDVCDKFPKLFQLPYLFWQWYSSVYDDDGEYTDEEAAKIRALACFDCDAETPDPDPSTTPTGQINYTGFVKWDVFQKAVDLIGNGFLDVQPGNGLYVDLAGTVQPDVVAYDAASKISPGGISSKSTFDFDNGKTYRFSIKVAGNNVIATGNAEDVLITIKDALLNVVYTRTITPTSWDMPFTVYLEEFVAASTYTDCKVYIEMVEDPSSINNIGPLIDEIVLTNVTDGEIMLSDDFDEENPVEDP